MLGDILGFAGNVFGSVLGSKSSRRAQEISAQQADYDRQWQAEFARHGLRWRVEDAQRAGIHPLYALGAQTHSFAPVGYSGGSGGGSDWSSGLGAAGQHLGRAIEAGLTRGERHVGAQKALAQAQERGDLENELLRAQIALTRSQVGPAFPSPLQGAMPGQGDHPEYTVNPVETQAVQPGHPTQAAGAHPGVVWERTREGGYRPQHNRELIEDADITSPPYLEWMWRNRILPSLGRERRRHEDPPPKAMLPPGAVKWEWDRETQQYMPLYPYRGHGEYSRDRRSWSAPLYERR